MKTLKYNLFLITLSIFCFFGCSDEDDPTVCDITVHTQEATVLGNTTAYLSFKALGKETGGIDKAGILYGTDASLANATDESKEYSGTEFNKTIKSLKRNTIYYFKGYVEDPWGNRIDGEILSFTTRNDPFSITTGGYTQTDSQYKYTGFMGTNGNIYKYSYSFALYATLVNPEEVESWGIVWFNEYYNLYYGNAEEGTRHGIFSLLANYSSGNHYYKAYAKLKDGSYRYGNIETVYYNYRK